MKLDSRTWFGCAVSFAAFLCAAATPLKPGERVVFYPTLGWPVPGGWEVEIHGCIYEPEHRAMTVPLLRRSLGLDEEELTPAEKAVFRDRARLFLVDHQDDRTVTIRLAGQSHALPASSANGHFVQSLAVGSNAVRATADRANCLRFETAPPSVHEPVVTGEIHLLSEAGLSVISDLDDTIKVSDVRDRRELLRNTLCRPFKSVDGMAAVYRAWATNRGAQFHYVSASPWQLYLPLAEFVQSNGFPAGSFHLRNCRVKDGTFLELFKSPEGYKPGVIEPMLKRLPDRRFVLVGDSGESDPEIYAALARKYPRQIVRILLRDVTGERVGAPRYQRVFGGLPGELWRVFREPAEIEKLVP